MSPFDSISSHVYSRLRMRIGQEDLTPCAMRRVSPTGRLRSENPSKPDFGAKERRQKAIAFLDNPEMLMMYAQSTGDVSVSRPRLPLLPPHLLDTPSFSPPSAPSAPCRPELTALLPCESIPAARLHFMKMMCSYDDETSRKGRRLRRDLAVNRSIRRRGDCDNEEGGDRTAGR